jgi:signal transduction histidine kinase
VSASSGLRGLAKRRVVRTDRGRVVAGVAAGIGEAFAVDPRLIRLIFALLTFASGAGIVFYVSALLILPHSDEETPERNLAFGLGGLAIGGSLMLSSLGLAGSLVWPIVLVLLGIALFRGYTAFSFGLPPVAGLALAAVGVIVFFQQNGLQGNPETLITPGAVVIGILMVVVPWLWRLANERNAEREARIRTQEREEMAARVHDSVLQTLALIQREDDPRRVAALARRQERDLRGWLYPDTTRVEGESLAAAIESAATEIEEVHSVRVEFVRTGDCPMDDRTRALALAAREAMANAARHAGVDEIAVFLDVEEAGVSLFVRDRGKGFDVSAVPGDRRGIAVSIRGRMARAGGRATITTTPGAGTGTEIELYLPGATQ